MATQTPNYSFDLPVVGADKDTWGGFLNGNWSGLDTTLKAIEDRVAAIEAAEFYKVGDLYMSTNADDPAISLGYGTWEAYGAGRALVGVGNNSEATWTGGETRGSENHTLIAAEMPSHNHSVPQVAGVTDTQGAHNHGHAGAYVGPFNGTNTDLAAGVTGSFRTFSTDGAHTHNVTVNAHNTDNAGSGAAHNNVQPSIAIYVWRRTL